MLVQPAVKARRRPPPTGGGNQHERGGRHYRQKGADNAQQQKYRAEKPQQPVDQRAAQAVLRHRQHDGRRNHQQQQQRYPDYGGRSAGITGSAAAAGRPAAQKKAVMVVLKQNAAGTGRGRPIGQPENGGSAAAAAGKTGGECNTKRRRPFRLLWGRNRQPENWFSVFRLLFSLFRVPKTTLQMYCRWQPFVGIYARLCGWDLSGINARPTTQYRHSRAGGNLGKTQTMVCFSKPLGISNKIPACAGMTLVGKVPRFSGCLCVAPISRAWPAVRLRQSR